MNYWLDLFTYQTWADFRKHGSIVSGFNEGRRKVCSRLQKGDIFLCYMVGVQRWVGALEVIGESHNNEKIWDLEDFPVRISVKSLIELDPEYGIPMGDLMGKLDVYKDEDKSYIGGFLRGSPNQFKFNKDGETILNFLKTAKHRPTLKPLDEKKINYVPTRYKVKRDDSETETEVIIPEKEEPIHEEVSEERIHTKIQYLLLELGSKLKLDLWVANNDRSKAYKGNSFSDMPGLLDKLPTTFQPATQKIIELIDVIWFHNNSIEAAFEIESTTSIYSGLLRMSDLIATQPNLDINLFLVAPEDRKKKVNNEILRPTFTYINPKRPLSQTCGYISFENLISKLSDYEKIGVDYLSLKPTFIKSFAQYFK